MAPCIENSNAADKAQLAAVERDLHRTYRESFADWQKAFEEGSSGETPAGTLFHISDDHSVIDSLRLSNSPSGQAMEMFRGELFSGELSCSPVAWWDEMERTWRPTMLIAATGTSLQFMPSARVKIIVPGTPFELRVVCGADLRPLDIATAGFSMCALPVLVRYVLRMHETLVSCGVESDELQTQPMLAAVSEMVLGAAREWRGQFQQGMPGPAPEPRITPLAPTMWGLTANTTADDVAAWWHSNNA